MLIVLAEQKYLTPAARARQVWPIWSQESAVYAVGPSNDHELAIAREIDKISMRDYLSPDVVPEMLAFLDFKVSSTDYEFLKRYMEWRMENPIVR